MTQIIQSLSDISSRYDALFVDLWGCVHNGIKAFPDAVAALRAYRERGGAVVLVTNSPRPRAGVEKQLDLFEVPRDCWDSIATSGDSARAAMFRGVVGQKVYFIGAPHDTSFFEPIKVIEDPVDIEIVPLDEAEGIVCTGPVDPMADPATYRADFLYAKTKGLKLLCANPDIVVDRGDHREWCAGAPFAVIAPVHHDVGIGAQKLQPLGLGVEEIGAVCGGIGHRVDRPGTDDALGLIEGDDFDIDRVFDHLDGFEKAGVMRRADEIHLLPHDTAKHRCARAVAGGRDTVPAIARHLEEVELLFDAGARARRICDQHHRAAAFSVSAQCGDRIGKGLDPVMHATPKIDEKRVIAAGDVRKRLDDLRHDLTLRWNVRRDQLWQGRADFATGKGAEISGSCWQCAYLLHVEG